MSLLTEVFDGTPGGMNAAVSAQDLDDNEARYLQDILVDYPGLIRRRGPLRKVAGTVEFTNKVSGIIQCLDPQGTNRVGVLHGTTSTGFLGALADTYGTKTDLSLGINLPGDPPANPYRIVSTSQAVGGGAMLGISDEYDTPTQQILAMWRGARKANYTTGTITSALNSVTVVGSGFTANVEPGMFLFADTDDAASMAFIGTVRAVTSNTVVTLEKGALHACTGKPYRFQSLRGLNPRAARGRITCDTTGTTVTGANSKFKDQGLTTGVWRIYRASDQTFVGKVSSVVTNTSLTLTANAAISMANEAYLAVRVDGDYGLSTLGTTDPSNRKVGFLSAPYAERQWYLNLGSSFEKTTYLWFSEPNDPESIDLSPVDGDFIPIGTSRGAPTPARALAAAYNALIILKESEAYALRGTTRSTFAVQKLTDDGTLSGMSVQSYAGGVIWAGREGIYFYDGIQTDNITQDKLGDYYKNMIRTFDPSKYRLWSMVDRDHYILFIEDCDPSIAVIKGDKSKTPSQIQIIINLPTRSITIGTNVNLRGAIQLPADTGEAAWYVANGYPSVPSTLTGQQSGGSPVTLSAGTQYATKITLAADGWAPRITAHLDGGGAGATGTCKVRASLYLDDGAGNPGSLLSAGNEVIISAGQAETDVAIDLKEGVRLTAGVHHLVLQTEKSSFVRVYQQAAAAGTYHTSSQTFKLGASDPFGTPTAAALQDRIWLHTAATGTLKGYVLDGSELFDGEGYDDYGCDSGVIGEFYFESKKFNAGDSLRRKTFKQVALHYLAAGANIRLDTVLGLNETGRTATSYFPASVPTWSMIAAQYGTWTALRLAYPTWSSIVRAVFRPKRIRFGTKRSSHLSFRLYQSSPLASRIQVGPFQVGYKLQRPGRIGTS